MRPLDTMAGAPEPCCKVGDAIARIGQDSSEKNEINEELVDRWTGADGGEPLGYRRLGTWFNGQLIRWALQQAGTDASRTRIEEIYATLTGDDDLEAAATRDLLRSEGVDVDRLEEAFVSWSTVGRHLSGCLDAEKPESQAATDWELNSVEIATSVLDEKVAASIASLTNKGKLIDGKSCETTITIELRCDKCPRRVPFSEALDRGYICPEHHDRPDLA